MRQVIGLAWKEIIFAHPNYPALEICDKALCFEDICFYASNSFDYETVGVFFWFVCFVCFIQSSSLSPAENTEQISHCIERLWNAFKYFK